MSKKAVVKSNKKEISTPEKSVSKDTFKVTLGIIIAAFSVLLYVQSISFDYTLDDKAVLVNNNLTTQGLSAIPKLLSTDYWYGFSQIRVPEYRPSSLVLFAIENQFFPNNPAIFHLVNVLIYSLSCWVLFSLLCILFKTQNLIFPFTCAMLYAAHPIHTEVVDSIKSCDELLAFLFGIMASLFLLKYLFNSSKLFLFIGLISFFFCLLSKESGITFLILMPLMFFFFTKIKFNKILLLTAILAGVTIVFLFIRWMILKNYPFGGLNYVLNNALYGAPDFISQKATAIYILLQYLKLLLIPHPLSFDYSIAQIPIQNITSVPVLISLVIYLALGIYALLNIRKKNVLSFAILFYLIAMAPVSNIFLLIGATMAERFLFVPSLAFCFAITYLLMKLMKVENSPIKFNNLNELLSFNKFFSAIIILIISLYSIKTFARSRDWKDDITLFSVDVKTATNSARTHYNYGNTLILVSYPAEKNEDKKNQILDTAIYHLKRAIEILPSYENAYRFLSTAYVYKNDFQNGLYFWEQYNKVRTMPDSTIHSNLSYLYGMTKQYDKQVSEIDSMLIHDPNNLQLFIFKSVALGLSGKDSEADTILNQAIKIDPKVTTAYKDIGMNYVQNKRYARALEYFKKAESVNPNDVELLKVISKTYLDTGDEINSRLYLLKAAQIKTK